MRVFPLKTSDITNITGLSHNLEVVSSNLAPATSRSKTCVWAFFLRKKLRYVTRSFVLKHVLQSARWKGQT